MNLNLEEVLLHRTDVGDLVLFRVDGWQIGCTMVDHEDLFINSLDNKLLKKEVKKYRYEEYGKFGKVMIVDLV